MAAHVVEGAVERLEHPEAEQVELHEADRRAVVLVPLQDAAVLHAGPLHRAHLHDGPVADHHAAGVDAEVAGRVLDLGGQLQHVGGDVAVDLLLLPAVTATPPQASTCFDQASCWPGA